MSAILGGVVGYRSFAQSHLPQMTQPTIADYYMLLAALFVTFVTLVFIALCLNDGRICGVSKHEANALFIILWCCYFFLWVAIWLFEPRWADHFENYSWLKQLALQLYKSKSSKYHSY